MPARLFTRALSLDGAGATFDIIADYSGANTELFQLTAASDEVLSVARILFSMQDATINSTDVFGGLATALTNGINLYVTDNTGAIKYYLAGEQPTLNIKTNAGLFAVCYDVTIETGFAQGLDSLHGRWTFAKYGAPVVLLPGWSLCLQAQDNFTGLDRHVWVCEGIFKDYAGNASNYD
jgi:hypothetical protein